ncbi:hypothetical protein [Rufibacter immobilis]|uniref:hypothetical protein n=1 Tax=Rufibacter immobilis TaxID=1348778 RepID=UPI0035E9FCA8
MKKSPLLKDICALTFIVFISLTSQSTTAQTAKPAAKAVTAAKPASTVAANTTPAKAKPAVSQKTSAQSSLSSVSPVISATESTLETPTVTPVAPTATKRKTSAAFEGGTNVVSLGIGLLDNLDFGYGSGGSTLKPITISYERGLTAEVGPGTIGVGGLISYAHRKWDDDLKVTFMYFAAKGTYHYDLLQNDQIDTYGGLTLGYARTNVKWDEDTMLGDYDASEGEVKIGFLVGARYFFTEQFGGFIELETGPMSHLSLGLSTRF